MKNLFEIKTTILGSLIIIAGLIYFFLPLFKDNLDSANTYVSIGLGIVGILLLIAPDALIEFIKELIKRRF